MSSSPAPIIESEHFAFGPGAIIGGKYRVDGVLGTGGMGVVLSATHLELDAPVAIKVVRDELAANEAIVSRLLFEARAAARMQSVHVVRVLDVARLDNGAPYIVMEKLRGRDVASLLQERAALPVAEALGYVLQACEGLIEAHGLGIVHRDLKPENLFLATTPEGVVLKILDFGISKDLGTTVREGSRTTLTKGGAAIGSPSYMAPEQIRAEPNLDARADIWSVGTILFELLAGRCPFEAETVASMYQKVLTEEPPSLLDFCPTAPRELDTVIRLCLRKDPEDRFQTMEELATALRSMARPVAVERARLESGVELTVQARLAPAAPPSLSLKLGIFATFAVLMTASVAFWKLQIAPGLHPASPASHPSAAVLMRPSAPAVAQPRMVVTPVPFPERDSLPAPSEEPPTISSAAKAAPARAAIVRQWPLPARKPAPVNPGVRYGL